MQHLKTFLLIVFLAVSGTFAASTAKANPLDQKTIITFSGPVELPGIALPAGTYVFKRLIIRADHTDFIQILSADGRKVIAVIPTIPDFREKITGKAAVNFDERAANTPPAIKSLFYPGSSYGEEFIYPRSNVPSRLAKAVTERDRTRKTRRTKKSPSAVPNP